MDVFSTLKSTKNQLLLLLKVFLQLEHVYSVQTYFTWCPTRALSDPESLQRALFALTFAIDEILEFLAFYTEH